jgi:hypothetical protein
LASPVPFLLPPASAASSPARPSPGIQCP